MSKYQLSTSSKGKSKPSCWDWITFQLLMSYVIFARIQSVCCMTHDVLRLQNNKFDTIYFLIDVFLQIKNYY